MGGFTSIFGGQSFPDAPVNGEAWGREDAAWVRVVAVDGDTMTGALTLSGNPVAPLQAATKEYVDTRITGTAQYIGKINATTGVCDYTAASGFPDGPVVPAATARNGYLICTVAGTIPGGEAAGITMAVGDWLLSDGVAWHDVPVGIVNILASHVAVDPPVSGWTDVQTALQGLPQGMVADVQPTEIRATATAQTWATIVASNLPANSPRRFMWLCQPQLYQPGTGSRTFNFGVPGIFGVRELIQPASNGQYPGFQVILIGRATTDAAGTVSMAVTIQVATGGDVTVLGGGGGITLRSRIQVFDMGTR